MYPFLISILIIIYATITAKNLRLGIFLVFACLPTYLLRLEILGVPTTFLEMMIVVLAVVWGIKKINSSTPWRRSGSSRDWCKLDKKIIWPTIPFVILLTAGVIGVVTAPDKMAALGILKAYIIEPIIFFFIVKTSLKWYYDAEMALKFLSLGALVVAGFAIFQHFTGLTIPVPWDVENRVTSFYPYPNAVGLFLGPIAILAINLAGRAMENKFYFLTWYWLIVFGGSVAAIIFSQTEAAWIAVPTALMISWLFNKKTRPISILMIIVAIVGIGFSSNLQNKIFLQDYSGNVRIKQWEDSANMLKENWLFGAGLSGYPSTLIPYHTYEEIEIFQYPHNIILNIWSELGLLGLLDFLLFFCYTVWLMRTAWQKKSSQAWLTIVCAAALLEMLIHGLVDVPFFKNDLSLLTAGLLAIVAWTATGPYAHPDQSSTK